LTTENNIEDIRELELLPDNSKEENLNDEDNEAKKLIGKKLIDEYKIKFLPSKVDNERLDYEIDKLKRNSYFIFFTSS